MAEEKKESTKPPVQECMILDDAELNSLSHRLQWRKKGTHDVQTLFHATKGKPEFPKAFQTYRSGVKQSETGGQNKFPFVRNETSKRKGEPFVPLTEDLKNEIVDPPYAPCTPPNSPGFRPIPVHIESFPVREHIK